MSLFALPRQMAAGAVLVVALLLTACSGSAGDVTSAGSAGQEEGGTSAQPTEAIRRPSGDVVEASLVRIVGFGCGAPTLGTGFAVESNLIVTNGHIITGRQTDSLAVQRADGTEYPAVVVGFDPDLDLALLRIDGATFRPLNLVTEVPEVEGVAIGIRTESERNVLNEVEFTVDAPVVVNWDGVFRDTESSYRGIRILADIRKGDSGSPLLINDRDTIGLVQSKTRGQPRGYAVRSVEIAEFVESIDPSVEVAAPRCA